MLLLKTKSTPTDAYEELFSTGSDGFHFEPHFVPVLQHRFQDEGIREIDTLLTEKRISNRPGCSYGGVIFTSQRAVEAFAKVVQDGRGRDLGQPAPVVTAPLSNCLEAIQNGPISRVSQYTASDRPRHELFARSIRNRP